MLGCQSFWGVRKEFRKVVVLDLLCERVGLYDERFVRVNRFSDSWQEMYRRDEDVLEETFFVLGDIGEPANDA